MGFQSILFDCEEVSMLNETPDFFRDLQLDYLLDCIMEEETEYETRQYFYTFPGSKELILYRQQIEKDMESEELCGMIQDFCRRMRESERIYALSLESMGEMYSATYHLQAAQRYWEALTTLHTDLKDRKFVSDGMKRFAEHVEKEIAALREQGFEEAMTQGNRIFSELKFQFFKNSESVLVTENSEEMKVDKRGKKTPLKNYFKELAELLGQETENVTYSMTDIFPEPLELSYMENALVGILKRSKPKVFQELCTFKEKFPKIYSEVLLRFEKEVQFYLCFQKFKARTLEKGYPFCVSTVSEKKEFCGNGVYDIALVWKQTDRNYKVVSNRFAMKDKPSFFVVTGPNQGGKTTFARSMGQAVYFSMMGLSTNAESFTFPLLQGIATHFEAEEKLQSNSGKLKEEINRLRPMMTEGQNCRNFVILNELFTTATTHDAMLMGRKVMEAFLERECYGIYVTHIQELAEETERIISLVAQLDPEEENKRTYRILPMEAQGYGYSDALVKKFQLEYEDIMRRLA